MHATLALAAAFWYAKMSSLPVAIQREGLRQKGEAMRQVMTQLTRQDLAPGSTTHRLLIAGVATLANIEVRYPFHFVPTSRQTQAKWSGTPTGISRRLSGSRRPP
jgi:hypothetical protein